MLPDHCMIGELVALYRLPDWKLRRAVDALGKDIPRAGQYRLVPRSMLPLLTLELQRRGWNAEREAVTT